MSHVGIDVAEGVVDLADVVVDVEDRLACVGRKERRFIGRPKLCATAVSTIFAASLCKSRFATEMWSGIALTPRGLRKEHRGDRAPESNTTTESSSR